MSVPFLCNELLSSVVFRLMLMASLWQGPILWGHSHQQVREGLADHIAKFHCEGASSWQLGWHWHCSLPWEIFQTSSDQDDNHQRQLPNPLDRARVGSSQWESDVSGDRFLIPDWTSSSWSTLDLGNAPNENRRGCRLIADREPASFYVLCRIVC